jgi:Pentapeptide repeats (8 copies)
VVAWNAWRRENPDIRPDLSNADLRGADLSGANLARANLREAFLFRANLGSADLVEANLRDHADLSNADLSGADLREAVLYKANLTGANLTAADLTGADLSLAPLVSADLTDADLTGCRIYGVSAWRLKLERTKQQSLIITSEDEPEITVDNIEVAQFIYLLLNNQKVRDVIDTITSKAVLILGRFTEERKAVLDAIREELRRRDYLPILFDFDKPANRDLTETISLLARMARFVVADITDAKAIPQELNVIVPELPSVPVQPLLQRESSEYGMFEHYARYPWVLPLYRYETRDQLIAALGEHVIEPAERKASELSSGAKPIPPII